jgi:heme-degrading monooxygenase HmoA
VISYDRSDVPFEQRRAMDRAVRVRDHQGRKGQAMIARIWRGVTKAEDAEAYEAYIEETGFADYKQAAGNKGAWILKRIDGDHAEFVTLSFWESREAIEAFAGHDIDKAVYYPEDDRYLIERELTVQHYEVG